MARDQVVLTCPAGEWTELTNADVTAITFQVLAGPVFIRFTTGSTPTEVKGMVYDDGQGELAKSISDLVNLASADRVWARPVGSSPGEVFVDHA